MSLARKQPNEAVERFDRAPAARRRPTRRRSPDAAQALAVARARRRRARRLEAAVAADPSLDLGARIEVLRFRGVGGRRRLARRAAEQGRVDEAREAYGRAIAVSPDSAFLYRELAAVEAAGGQRRRRDRAPAAGAGARPGRREGGRAARRRAGARRPVRRGGQGLRGRAGHRSAAGDRGQARACAAPRRAGELPAEYQAIPAAPEVTRGDVAAVLGYRLGAALPPVGGRQGMLVTDVRSHWAATVDPGRWCAPGVMEPLPNHTFQPPQRVRRVDLRANRQPGAGLAAARSRPPRPSGRPPATLPTCRPAIPRIRPLSQAVAAGVLAARRRRVPAVAAGHRRGAARGRRPPRAPLGRPAAPA